MRKRGKNGKSRWYKTSEGETTNVSPKNNYEKKNDQTMQDKPQKEQC